MTKVERIRKALICCTTMTDGCYPLCEECPYADEEEGTCLSVVPMYKDILSALDARYPRVLTPSELKPDVVYWMEKYNVTQPWPVAFNGEAPHYDGTKNYIEGYCGTKWDLDLYGKTWRVWSDKPTSSMSRAAKWANFERRCYPS